MQSVHSQGAFKLEGRTDERWIASGTGVPRSSLKTPAPLITVPRHSASIGSYGGVFFMSEVPLYGGRQGTLMQMFITFSLSVFVSQGAV